MRTCTSNFRRTFSIPGNRTKYEYDGINQRIEKTTGGNTDDFYYNENWQILEVRRNGNANPREQYTWDAGYIDTPIFKAHDAATDGTVDNYYYYMTDANHNVTAIYDSATGTIVERYLYDPYGRVQFYDRIWTKLSSSAKDNYILFGGYVFDPETGMNNVRNRQTLHSTLGRWGQRDFEVYIDGANLFQYLRSSPSRSTDPTGLYDPWEAYDPKVAAQMQKAGITLPTSRPSSNSWTPVGPLPTDSDAAYEDQLPGWQWFEYKFWSFLGLAGKNQSRSTTKYLRCVQDCITKYDPLTGMDKYVTLGLGQPIPKVLLRAPHYKGYSAFTTMPSRWSMALRLKANSSLRFAGRLAYPVAVFYGVALAAVETGCAISCLGCGNNTLTGVPGAPTAPTSPPNWWTDAPIAN